MKLKVVSYNTQSGFAAGRKVHDFSAQADEIAKYSPDVVALQEVAIRHPMGKPVDYPAETAKILKMQYVFSEALSLGKNGRYGVAVLSKFPLETVARLKLPVPEKIEPHIALIVKVHAPVPFHVVSTHLSYQGEFDGDDNGRIEQIRSILAYVADHRLFPILLAGDLNSSPRSGAVQALREKFDVFNDSGSGRPTAETGKYGWMQIDYISGSPHGTFKCRSFKVGDDCTASDHYAVIAELDLD